jgi:hypothetical protein
MTRLDCQRLVEFGKRNNLLAAMSIMQVRGEMARLDKHMKETRRSRLCQAARRMFGGLSK